MNLDLQTDAILCDESWSILAMCHLPSAVGFMVLVIKGIDAVLAS